LTDIASLIADMVRAGVDPELIGRTAEALVGRVPVRVVDEQAERRREIDRLRKQNNWPALRLAVFERDGFRCVYCGCDVSMDPQCDHIHPISRGGANSVENLATACRPCNSSKGDKTPEEWRQ